MSNFLNGHIFAFYTPIVAHLAQRVPQSDIYQLTDLELVHRISTVLRLDTGDSIILFDTHNNIKASLISVTKKYITLELHAIESNKILEPSITWLLPVLKREAFEEALYTLAELGAQVIQPVLTAKTTRVWGGEKEMVRSQKIIIAAAEQSKNYRMPQMAPLVTLEQWLIRGQQIQVPKLFFDATGAAMTQVLSSVKSHKELIVFAGPEGDLTPAEKELLHAQNFIFCSLTPTVLRAQQAVTVGLGILRSLL